MCRALAVALQFEDPESGPIGALLLRVRSAQALEPRLRLGQANHVLLCLDVAKHGCFADIEPSLGKIGFGLFPLEAAFLHVGGVVRLSLPRLVGEIVVARRALAALD